jgi:protein disulfide-isomerase
VQGFPTIHLAKAVKNDGQINFQGLGSTGYVPGGPNAF